MLSCCRCIAPGDRSVRRGEWKVIMGHDLCEKTVGLLGFGNISKCVARRLRGFGCKVLAYDPFVTEVPEEFRDFVTLGSLEMVIEGSDVLSLHLPLTNETRNIISARELAMMKPGSYLVNTSRGRHRQRTGPL